MKQFVIGAVNIGDTSVIDDWSVSLC